MCIDSDHFPYCILNLILKISWRLLSTKGVKYNKENQKYSPGYENVLDHFPFVVLTYRLELFLVIKVCEALTVGIVLKVSVPL